MVNRNLVGNVGVFYLSEKEMRRLGFGLARVRYDELRPLISELEEIEADILEMQKVGSP